MTETFTASGSVKLYPIYWGNIIVYIVSARSDEEAQRKADELWREWTMQEPSP